MNKPASPEKRRRILAALYGENPGVLWVGLMESQADRSGRIKAKAQEAERGKDTASALEPFCWVLANSTVDLRNNESD